MYLSYSFIYWYVMLKYNKNQVKLTINKIVVYFRYQFIHIHMLMYML